MDQKRMQGQPQLNQSFVKVRTHKHTYTQVHTVKQIVWKPNYSQCCLLVAHTLHTPNNCQVADKQYKFLYMLYVCMCDCKSIWMTIAIVNNAVAPQNCLVFKQQSIVAFVVVLKKCYAYTYVCCCCLPLALMSFQLWQLQSMWHAWRRAAVPLCLLLLQPTAQPVLHRACSVPVKQSCHN